MAHIQDRWTTPGPSGRRVKSDRHGQGKRWRVLWEEGAARKSRSFDTKDAAEIHLSKIRVDQHQGTHIVTTRTTVGEYGDDWIKTRVHLRDSSASQMEIRWRVHIRPVLGHILLADLTRRQVQAAVQAWMVGDKTAEPERKPLAPATIDVVYGYLSSMMKAAVKDRLIPASPCDDINRPKSEDVRVVPLTTEQVHQIAACVQPRYRAMILLGAATGMRSGELRGLTAGQLVWGEGWLRIDIDRQLVTTEPKWGPPKTAKSKRIVQVGGQTAAMLLEHLNTYPPHASGLIFTGRTRGPIARTTMSTVWNQATDAAGLKLKDRSGWHELRHHHASLLIAAGLSVVAVADRLGHKDSKETLETYAHLWGNDESRAIAAIEGSLWPQPVPAVNQSSQHPYSTRAIPAEIER